MGNGGTFEEFWPEYVRAHKNGRDDDYGKDESGGREARRQGSKEANARTQVQKRPPGHPGEAAKREEANRVG